MQPWRIMPSLLPVLGVWGLEPQSEETGCNWRLSGDAEVELQVLMNSSFDSYNPSLCMYLQ
jgi:hypothetical protein